ncbi:MAG: hypothetical protein J0H29_21025 [Sphingobacteriales bacterium]|nr:hypothetical protein [Sphingobacteriales bacterium]
MTSEKQVILTAINFKGVEQVKREAKELAEKLFCSEQHVLNIIRKVEKQQIIVKQGSK